MKHLSILVGLLAVVAMVVSCGGQQPAPAPKPSAAPPAAPSPVPSASPSPSAKPSPSAAPAGQPKYGGTLRYVANVAGGYDQHMRPSYSSFYCQPVFNFLVTFSMDPKKTGGGIPENLVGDLAERWEVSADGKTCTFFLVKNAKWHDGKPFTADDVVYSMQKMTDPKRSSITSSFPAFDRVEKVDDYTVKMYLKSPSPSFLLELALASTSAMQAKHKAGTDPRSTDFLVGTGPFKYKSSVPGVSFTLTRNPDYFKKGLPYLDNLELNTITERSAMADALVSNRLDTTNPTTGIPDVDILERIRKQAPTVLYSFVPTDLASLLWLNTDYAPLKDVRVRRALALLVDARAIRLAKSGNEEFGSFQNPLLSPNYGMPDAELKKQLGWDKPMDQRIAEAKKLMADAGYADGFKLNILVQQLPEYQRALSLLADTYRRNLNVQAELVIRDTVELGKMRAAKDWQMYYGVPLAYLGDPDEYMGYFKTGAPDNFAKYSNPATDKLWEQQSVTMDSAKRREITREIEKQILTDLPAIPTDKTRNGVAWWPYVKNYLHDSPRPYMVFENVWLDK